MFNFDDFEAQVQADEICNGHDDLGQCLSCGEHDYLNERHRCLECHEAETAEEYSDTESYYDEELAEFYRSQVADDLEQYGF